MCFEVHVQEADFRYTTMLRSLNPEYTVFYLFSLWREAGFTYTTILSILVPKTKLFGSPFLQAVRPRTK